MNRLTLVLALTALALAAAGAGGARTPAAGLRALSIFYYPWYGTPERDGAYLHWEQDGHLPPVDLASNYYPARGPYSSADPAVVRAHVAEMAAAGVGEIVSSWWGWGSLEDQRLPLLLRAARARGLDVAVQIEPYAGRTAATVEAGVAHLREVGIRRFYVYRPFDGIDPASWAALNARLTGVEVLAQTGSVAWAVAAGFDGVYTYDVVRYGPGSLARLCGRARAAGLACAPSVGPGYEADRATGDGRARRRRAGAAYDAMWRAAIAAGADRITITSYNEWHEGTQIEPARTPAPRSPSASPVERPYQSYEGAYGLAGRAAERAYLLRTAFWAKAFAASQVLREGGR